MGVAIVLALLFPEPGAEGGILQPHLLTKAGVALIFFLHGLTLSFSPTGSLKWRGRTKPGASDTLTPPPPSEPTARSDITGAIARQRVERCCEKLGFNQECPSRGKPLPFKPHNPIS